MEKSKQAGKDKKVKINRPKERKGNWTRKTTETDIKLSLNINGKGACDINTGVPFFNHMLEQFSKHSRFDMTLNARGDIEVDLHHLIEDTGIVIGGALKELSGDKKGIRRFGSSFVPMDEALVQSSVDFCGRAFFVYNKNEKESRDKYEEDAIIAAFNRNKKKEEMINNPLSQTIFIEMMAGKFLDDYVHIFFDAISKNALLTLHINVIYGSNKHHIVEAIFKSAGIAVSDTLKIDGNYGIPSTKGSI